jgi:hypothetical protein
LLAGDDRLGGVKTGSGRVGDDDGERRQVLPLFEKLELRIHRLVLVVAVGGTIVEPGHADHLGDPAVHLDPVEQSDGAEVVPVRLYLRGAEAVPVLLHYPGVGCLEEAGQPVV